MAFYTKVGSFNADTTKTVGQYQDVTDIGFEPKVVILFYGGSAATGDSVSGGTCNIGIGASNASGSRWNVMGCSMDNQGTSDTCASASVSEVIRFYSNTSTISGAANLTSMLSNGFRLQISTQFAQTYRISYLAIGGDGLSNVYVGSRPQPTATGSYVVSGVGFKPDAAIFAGVRNTSHGAGANLNFEVGVATSGSLQGTVSAYSQDASNNMVTAGYGFNGECSAVVSSGTACTARLKFLDFNDDGFTLNKLEGTSAYQMYFVALKGGQYAAGELNTSTGTGDITEELSFQPKAILFASANRPLSTQDVATDNDAVSLGAATSGSERACASIWDEDTLGTSETAYCNYDSEVYASIAHDALVAAMDVKSTSGTGFICVMDTPEPTNACWVTYLAIGEPQAPSGNIAGSAGGVAQVTGGLVGTGVLAGQTDGLSTASGNLQGAVYIAGSAGGMSDAAGMLLGAGALVGAVDGAASVVGGMLGTGALSGSLAAAAEVVGSLTSDLFATGSADGISSVSGALAGTGDMVGSTSGMSGVTGELVGGGALTGAITGIAGVDGTIGATGALVGSANGTSQVTGELQQPSGSMSGNTAGTSTAEGTLRGIGALSGVADGLAGVAGALVGSAALSGSIVGTSDAIASLAGTGLLSGLADGVSGVMGTLVGVCTLAGASNGTSNVTGALEGLGSGDMVGWLVASATVAGALQGIGALYAACNGVGTTSGTLIGIGYLAGSSSGLADGNGILRGTGALVATCTGIATVFGELSMEGQVSMVGWTAGTSVVVGQISAYGIATITPVMRSRVVSPASRQVSVS